MGVQYLQVAVSLEYLKFLDRVSVSPRQRTLFHLFECNCAPVSVSVHTCVVVGRPLKECHVRGIIVFSFIVIVLVKAPCECTTGIIERGLRSRESITHSAAPRALSSLETANRVQ